MKVSSVMALFLCVSSPLLAQSDHRPIELDEKNPHYFQYGGRTIALITSGEHYGAIINADFDGDKYLDALQKDGLNYTRIFPGSYVEVPAKSFGIQHNTLAPAPGKFIAPWARSKEPGYAGGGNRFDLDQWDPEYFRRFHAYLSAAEQRGIIVELSLFSSQYGDDQWAVSVFNSKNNVNHTNVGDWHNVNTLANGNVLAYQERYVRKLVDEANSFPNVTFEIQNEPWSDHPLRSQIINPYMPPPGREFFANWIDVADADSLAWQKRVAEWITSEEARLPYHHLIAQNYCNFYFPVGDTAPGVSILNFHYAYPAAVSSNYSLNKPISYDESGFLGQKDADYRRQAWNFMLSGGSTFDGLDYSFTPGHEDGNYLEPNGPGGGSPAFRRQLGVLHEFLDKLPLDRMKTDTHTVAHAEGVFVRLLSGANGTYAAYLDGEGPSRLTLDLPSGEYSGEWVDPESGSATPIPSFHSNGKTSILLAPGFENGLALRLVRE